MKIEFNVVCECGNDEDFLEIDCLDYVSENSYREFNCNRCYTRIITEKPIRG